MKILVSDSISEEGLRVLHAVKGLEVDLNTKLSPEELAGIISGYDALIIRSATKVTADTLKNPGRLKVIGRAGVGVDNVDVEAATKRGIIVMNTPDGNTISTAEHTMSMLLALSRNIPAADRTMKEGKWEKKKFMGVELHGKNLGVLGLGRIGTEVAKRAKAFGMNVLAYDPLVSREKGAELEISLVDFDTLLKEADYITVHATLTSDTRHIISDEAFEKVKPGVRIINCARGGIVDERALLAALASGRVGGCALDVFEKEPPGDGSLTTHEKVVATPHLGASTEEAQEKVAVEVAKQVVDALTGKGIRNAVNMPNVDAELYRVLEPYINLSEKIGLLQAQLVKGNLSEVRVEYSGEVAAQQTAPLTVGLVKGLLSRLMGENVNSVNAIPIAREKGIRITETRSERCEDYASLIRCEVVTDREKSRIAGTLFTRVDPRVVMIGDFHVDIVPDGDMIITSNEDKPGIIGNVGTALGNSGINIAGMTFGRAKKGGKAIMVLNIDSPPGRSLLDEIAKLPHILDVKAVSL